MTAETGATRAITVTRKAVAPGARRAGISPDEYVARRAAGLKHCAPCQTWHPLDQFVRRATSPDGRDGRCAEANRTAAREGMRRLYARRRAEREAGGIPW